MQSLTSHSESLAREYAARSDVGSTPHWYLVTHDGRRGSPSTTTAMTQRHHECKAIFCTGGWLEIRESDNPDGWVACNEPVWIVP